MDIRAATKADRDWIVEESAPLGGPEIVSLGVLHSITDHEALVAIREGERVGFAVYRPELPLVELIGLRAMDQWAGTGTALMQELEVVAMKIGGRTIILCTTNDNLSAIKFYQRRGFRFKAVHPRRVQEHSQDQGL